jgi:hypothetical protein
MNYLVSKLRRLWIALAFSPMPGQGAWEAGRLGLVGGAALGWFRPHESWDRLGR